MKEILGVLCIAAAIAGIFWAMAWGDANSTHPSVECVKAGGEWVSGAGNHYCGRRK